MLTWSWQRELFAFNCPSIEVCDKFEAVLNDIHPRPKAEDSKSIGSNDEQGSKNESHKRPFLLLFYNFPTTIGLTLWVLAVNI